MFIIVARAPVGSSVVHQIPLVDASVFVGDDDVDKGATAEAFLLVAGLSTTLFAVAFNVPFIVAPSVLYASRGPGCV